MMNQSKMVIVISILAILVCIVPSTCFCDTIPAPCITDIKDEAKKILHPPAFIDLDDVINERVADIDLDKTQDRLFAFRRHFNKPGYYHWALFASNNGCVKFVGEFAGMKFTILETLSSGYKNIRIIESIEKSECVIDSYEFNGSMYQASKRERLKGCKE
jgi:hypothetical protein